MSSRFGQGIGNQAITHKYDNTQILWISGLGESDATIYVYGPEHINNDEVQLWQAYIVTQGLQRELESLSDSSQEEINHGWFRIEEAMMEHPNQSEAYKALQTAFEQFLELL